MRDRSVAALRQDEMHVYAWCMHVCMYIRVSVCLSVLSVCLSYDYVLCLYAITCKASWYSLAVLFLSWHSSSSPASFCCSFETSITAISSWHALSSASNSSASRRVLSIEKYSYQFWIIITILALLAWIMAVQLNAMHAAYVLNPMYMYVCRREVTKAANKDGTHYSSLPSFWN